MFLPENLKEDADKESEEAAARRRDIAIKNIEMWSLDLIPQNIRKGVLMSIQEVKCGDPTCAPIDTATAILFPA